MNESLDVRMSNPGYAEPGSNAVLQTSATFDMFLQQQRCANQSQVEKAIEMLRPLRLRYFSPTELLRIFHFTPPQTETHFLWPDQISEKTKYRMLGNSVNVEVVRRLIVYLFEGDIH